MIVDRVIIVGDVRTKPETIERELLLQPGQPLGYADLGREPRAARRPRPVPPRDHRGDAARRRAAARRAGARRGVAADRRSAAAAVSRAPSACGRTRPAQAVERFEFVPRGFFEIGRRNLWGKNRAVNLFTRVSVRNRDVGLNPDGTPAAESTAEATGFNEYRVVGTFREPRVFGSSDRRAGHRHPGAGDPIQLQLRPPRAARRGRAAAVAASTACPAATRFERTELFDERFTDQRRPAAHRPALPAGPAVHRSPARSSATRATTWSTRRRARSLTATADLAARAIGSEVGFVKTFVEGSRVLRSCRRRGAPSWRSARGSALANGFPRLGAARRGRRRRADDRGPGRGHEQISGQQALLRRRRHHRARLRARPAGRREHDQPAPASRRAATASSS